MSTTGSKKTPPKSTGQQRRPASKSAEVKERSNSKEAIENKPRAESRWPAVAAIVVVLVLYALLPSTIPSPIRYTITAIGAVILVLAIIVNPLETKRQKPWSRPLSLILITLLALANELDLVTLIIRFLQPAQKEDAPMLLTASAQVWSVNIIVFALIFWQLDRGGPVTRTQAEREDLPEADFRFPQDEDYDSVVEVTIGSSKKSDWTANFIDYLYFSLSNAMAFSPPDAVPLTNRMKIIVGIEALGAYVLLVLVIARTVSLFSS